MNPRVKSVEALSDFKLQVQFSNDELGVYDCSHLLDFGVFKELQEVSYFQRVAAVDGTVCWPNEQDICPDTVYLDSVKIARGSLKVG